MALGLGPGDEVIVPSFSFAATANAVRLVGAEPVFADIEPDSFCLDPAAVAAAITPRTVAIMPVHLYGHPAAMDRAHGDRRSGTGWPSSRTPPRRTARRWHGQPVGAFGTAGCFSFYPTKNMHSLEGGMITTADAGLARTLRLLRNQGMEQRYANEIVGANMRLTDVAAAIGRVQLRPAAGWTEQRRANAKFFDARITGCRPCRRWRTAPGTSTTSTRCGSPATGTRAQARSTGAGVGSAVYYPTPIHRLKPYLGAGRHARRLGPAGDRAGRRRGRCRCRSIPSLTPASSTGSSTRSTAWRVPDDRDRRARCAPA